MNTQLLEIEIIKSVLKKKGYTFFENGVFNLNIIGIRSNIKQAGSFDDFICCIYKDDQGNWICKHWKATTDAGTYWLAKPMRESGAALLVPNQYRGAFKIGYFKGRYKALIQHKPMPVYRDNTRDRILDFDPKTIQTGMWALAIHKSNPMFSSVINDKWSAGCQVFSSPNDFNEFVSIFEKSAKIYGDTFTYTLLEEKDFE